MNNIITEDVHLPSEGKLYNEKINPEVKIRAMTTDQEMRRLSHSDRPNKNLCTIIDECIVGDELGISSYDLSLGDYQYLLHRLRVATYGQSYNIVTTCPYCFGDMESKLDLDSLETKYFNESLEKYLEFELPRSNKRIKLKVQTPHSLDNINAKVKEFKKKTPDADTDPTLIYTVSSLIDTVDGEILDPVKLDRFVRQLPLMDINYIVKANEKINEEVGINPLINIKCKHCGLDYTSSFRLTSEFFGPSID